MGIVGFEDHVKFDPRRWWLEWCNLIVGTAPDHAAMLRRADELLQLAHPGAYSGGIRYPLNFIMPKE